MCFESRVYYKCQCDHDPLLCLARSSCLSSPTYCVFTVRTLVCGGVYIGTLSWSYNKIRLTQIKLWSIAKAHSSFIVLLIQCIMYAYYYMHILYPSRVNRVPQQVSLQIEIMGGGICLYALRWRLIQLSWPIRWECFGGHRPGNPNTPSLQLSSSHHRYLTCMHNVYMIVLRSSCEFWSGVFIFDSNINTCSRIWLSLTETCKVCMNNKV